jgi:phthalate 3,4-dioxygenase subunit beta
MGRVGVPQAEFLPFTSPDHLDSAAFLVHEAQLLDERRYEEWLGMLTEDIEYRMPVRVTRAHDLADSVLEDMDHYREDLYSLTKRVDRFATEHAWTEDPPSRTRHLVTNIRVDRRDAEEQEELSVRSYVLVFRSRLDVRPPDWICAERTDVLRWTSEGLRLARRNILVDESVLRTQNLAVFL